MYRTVNLMLGDIIKVTPSSKMVGDLAIFMVQNDLTPENIVERGESLAFPDSVVSYFKGMMGQPPCGFPKDLQRVVLKGEKPIEGRPGDLLEPVDFEKLRKEVASFYPGYEYPRSLISYAMYPKVYEEFIRHRKEYGYIMRMGSHVFFNGMAIGETNQINIEDGKTLIIKYLGLGDLNADGTRNVQFELNGMRREVAVPDPKAADSVRPQRQEPDRRIHPRHGLQGRRQARRYRKAERCSRRHRGDEDGDQHRCPHGRHGRRNIRQGRAERQGRRAAAHH